MNTAHRAPWLEAIWFCSFNSKDHIRMVKFQLFSKLVSIICVKIKSKTGIILVQFARNLKKKYLFMWLFNQ